MRPLGFRADAADDLQGMAREVGEEEAGDLKPARFASPGLVPDGVYAN